MPEKIIYHRMEGLNTRMAANCQRGFGPTRLEEFSKEKAMVILRKTDDLEID
jgi:hypothetical protein